MQYLLISVLLNDLNLLPLSGLFMIKKRRFLDNIGNGISLHVKINTLADRTNLDSNTLQQKEA